jgi:transposase-like protein
VGRRGYPPEFRRRMLDLVEAGRPIAEVAQALGISTQSIYTWRRQDRIDRGLGAGPDRHREDGKAYVRNRRLSAPPDETTSSNLADLGWAATRTRAARPAGNPWSGDVAGREATAKDGGVVVARLQGHSWAPTASNGLRVNVGTIPAVPSPGQQPGGWREGPSPADAVGRGGACSSPRSGEPATRRRGPTYSHHRRGPRRSRCMSARCMSARCGPTSTRGVRGTCDADEAAAVGDGLPWRSLRRSCQPRL